jgi:hypothetical protein
MNEKEVLRWIKENIAKMIQELNRWFSWTFLPSYCKMNTWVVEI